MRILAISGSLRAASSNNMVLQAIRNLAPENIDVKIYDALDKLPHFNPDLDGDTPPDAVHDLRALIGNSDGVIISCPEYAHGVPGSLKNALDWLVGSLEFSGKPVALINTSPRATHAQESLQEILITMSARLIPEAFATVSLLGRAVDAQAITSDPELSGILSRSISAFALAINSVLAETD